MAFYDHKTELREAARTFIAARIDLVANTKQARDMLDELSSYLISEGHDEAVSFPVLLEAERIVLKHLQNRG